MKFQERYQKIWLDSKFIRQGLWTYRKRVGLGLLTLVVVDSLEVFPALILKGVVDSIIDDKPTAVILKLAFAYASIALVQGFCRYGWRVLLIRSSHLSARDLRNQFAAKVFDLPATYFDKNQTGDLMSMATHDVESVRSALGPGLLVIADALFYFATIPIAMLWLSPSLTLIAVVPLPLIVWLVLKTEKKLDESYTEVQDGLGKISALSQETFTGIRVLKTFAREGVQLGRHEKLGKHFVSISMRLARVQSAFGPVLDFSVSLSLVALVFIGGRMVIRGDVTVGTFVAFQQYVQMIIWPMIAVGIGINHFQRAAISTRRLSSFFDVPNPIVRSTTPELPKGFNPGPWKTPGAVSVRGLSFRYPSSDRPILSNVSFEIGAGERIGIMGPVGSGKTTLLYLLPRLYEVPKATIFVDGVDVNEWPLDVLRAQMGFVTQETFLFSDTIGHNIAFESEMNSMIEAASMASSFHQEVLAFDKRYETLLGERGVNLSGGQRQRLTIARALARDPSILLLDDSLSSVDVKTERLILDGLKNRPHRNTEIIAAHRVSTVEEADRVLVFIEGKILEIGTPKELRDRSTSYFSKLSIQQKMQEELKAKIEGVDVHV